MGRRLNFSWRSWAQLFQFELLYKLLSLTVFVPLAWALFNVSLRAAGLRYLDAANLKAFLTWRRSYTPWNSGGAGGS